MPTETATTVLKIGVVGAAAHTALSLAERKTMARKMKRRKIGGARPKLTVKPKPAASVLGRGRFVTVVGDTPRQSRSAAETLASRVRSQGGKADVQDRRDVIVKVTSKKPVALDPKEWTAGGARGEVVARRFR
jgi:hypothetical protein